MINLSACIEMLFSEHEFYDRFKAAHDAGVKAVEFWGWSRLDIGRIKELKTEYKLPIAAMCVDTLDLAVKEQWHKFAMLHRESPEYFVKVVEQSITVAKELDVRTLIVTTGNERKDATRYEQHLNVVRCLKAAGPMLLDAGVTLVLEPLNVLTDHHGYFLPSSYEAFAMIEEADQKNVRVLYDVYHQQITEGNLIPTIRKNIELIGHFHTADVPGRLEPGTGEINYRNVFAAIAESGYKKYVGVESRVTKPTAEAWKDVAALTV